jgi:hypothetical protein
MVELVEIEFLVLVSEDTVLSQPDIFPDKVYT